MANSPKKNREQPPKEPRTTGKDKGTKDHLAQTDEAPAGSKVKGRQIGDRFLRDRPAGLPHDPVRGDPGEAER